jgi:hypothetical protein
MGPKLLGGGAALLAVAFILALPSIFVGEPADDVEPISFGPPPVARLAEAAQVTAPAPIPLEPGLPEPSPIAPVVAPVVTFGGGRDEEGAEAAGGLGASSEDPRDDLSEGGDENESAAGDDPGEVESGSLDDDDTDDLGGEGAVDEDEGDIGEDDVGESEDGDDGEEDD